MHKTTTDSNYLCLLPYKSEQCPEGKVKLPNPPPEGECKEFVIVSAHFMAAFTVAKLPFVAFKDALLAEFEMLAILDQIPADYPGKSALIPVYEDAHAHIARRFSAQLKSDQDHSDALLKVACAEVARHWAFNIDINACNCFGCSFRATYIKLAAKIKIL